MCQFLYASRLILTCSIILLLSFYFSYFSGSATIPFIQSNSFLKQPNSRRRSPRSGIYFSIYTAVLAKKKIYFSKIKFPHLSFGWGVFCSPFFRFVYFWIWQSDFTISFVCPWVRTSSCFCACVWLYGGFDIGGGSSIGGLVFWLVSRIVRRAKNYLWFMLVVVLMFFLHFCLKHLESNRSVGERARDRERIYRGKDIIMALIVFPIKFIFMYSSSVHKIHYMPFSVFCCTYSHGLLPSPSLSLVPCHHKSVYLARHWR